MGVQDLQTVSLVCRPHHGEPEKGLGLSRVNGGNQLWVAQEKTWPGATSATPRIEGPEVLRYKKTNSGPLGRDPPEEPLLGRTGVDLLRPKEGEGQKLTGWPGGSRGGENSEAGSPGQRICS